MDESSSSASDASDDLASVPDVQLASPALLDAVSDGIYQLDRDGYFVAVNDALTDLSGYDRDALLGKHVSMVLDSEDVVRGETAIRDRLLAGAEDSIRLTFPMFTAEGKTLPCEVCVSAVVQDGEFRGSVGVVRTVDDPNVAAEVRNASERRQAFDALAEASADGIVMLDDESVVRYANPAVERILGYAPEELVGDPQVEIIPKRLRQAHTEAFQKYLDTNEKHVDWTYLELPGLHEDGHEIPLAISINDFEHDGERYFVGTFRDISKRKAVERELERQNDRLDQFASLLAHELRNPLQTAQIYLDFVEDGDEASIEQIAEALDRIDEIIEVLLVLARSQSEVGDREAVGLADAAAEAWAEIETDGATLEADTPRILRVNPMHLQHLLENLFRNAVEHAGDDVTVRVGALEDVSASSAEQSSADRSSGQRPREDEASGGSTDSESVGGSPERSEDEARQGAKRTAGGFYVEDDGSGIPDAERASVVEAGYTTDAGGIGLGLTFVAQLVDAYGWEYDITESESGGARFEFTDVETANDD